MVAVRTFSGAAGAVSCSSWPEGLGKTPTQYATVSARSGSS